MSPSKVSYTKISEIIVGRQNGSYTAHYTAPERDRQAILEEPNLELLADDLGVLNAEPGCLRCDNLKPDQWVWLQDYLKEIGAGHLIQKK